MIYLHKILPLLLSPIVVVLLMALIGLATRRKSLAYAALLVLYVASMPITGDAMMRLTERYAVRESAQHAAAADAIVVLSGMVRHVEAKQGLAAEWGDASDRFFAGVELYRDGKARDIYFTGGKRPWESAQEPEGEVLARMARALGIPSNHIHITPDAQNTEQEALALRKMIRPDNASILLVTSAFHMPRSVMMFEKAGFRSIIPFPVDFRVWNRDVTLMDFLPDADALADTDLAIREAIGIAYYLIRQPF